MGHEFFDIRISDDLISVHAVPAGDGDQAVLLVNEVGQIRLQLEE
jgi:hypothetical protein